jgi:hypothetical protein
MSTDSKKGDRTMQPIGKKLWCIPGGHIPLHSTGREPASTSREELCFLNVGDRDACARLTFYYADREPVGPYELKITARRCRRVRVNDLIEPEAVPLDTDYGVVIESDVPIVVQFSRVDTSTGALATSSALAYEADVR